MKLGIIGLPGSGKTTVFRALTGGVEPSEHKGRQEPGLGVVKVEDRRLQFLSEHYKTKKSTPVYVEYLDVAGLTGEGKSGRGLSDKLLAHLRPVEALIHCVRFFDSAALGPAEPLKDIERVEEEVILSDLASIEKRIEKIAKDMKKGRKELSEELSLLEQARDVLEQGKPLRFFPPAAESEALRGFAFLSAKPELFLVNASDDQAVEGIESLVVEIRGKLQGQSHVAVDWLYADNEAEIARLDPEDAREFLQELHQEEGAKNRVVRTSFDLLRLIVFFTAGEKEVRGWQLRLGQTALAAAGTVHSDMERGFIRAEVVAFQDFKEAGSLAQAQKVGKVRLEGRDYGVNDGDVILFRFNV